MDYKDKIAASSIIFKIRKTALNVFSGWAHNAHYYEEISEEILKNINDDVIANDFSECLSDAIQGVSNKIQEKKEIFGWPYGFVCGFIEGSIHEKWYARYIIQQSDEYKKASFFHSAYKMYEIDQKLIVKTHTLYRYYLQQDLEGMINDNPKENDYSKFSLEENNQFKDEFLDYMKTESMKNFINILQKKSENYCPKVGDHLSQKEVEKLLEDCGVY